MFRYIDVVVAYFYFVYFDFVVQRNKKRKIRAIDRHGHERAKNLSSFLKKKWRKLTDHVADLVNTLIYLILFIFFSFCVVLFGVIVMSFQV